ncbi:MAG TPA: hypothetical protein VJX74_16150 [Blastocatellia bacterium]|nr:hypothetical protein [Blastocatellia bacterium]
MAKILDFELVPTVNVTATYAMIGRTIVDHFNEAVEIEVYIFISEAARRQDMSLPPELRRPLKVIPVKPPIHLYQAYIADTAKLLAAAGYKLMTEVEEGSAANPWGLANLFAVAENV